MGRQQNRQTSHFCNRNCSSLLQKRQLAKSQPQETQIPKPQHQKHSHMNRRASRYRADNRNMQKPPPQKPQCANATKKYPQRTSENQSLSRNLEPQKQQPQKQWHKFGNAVDALTICQSPRRQSPRKPDPQQPTLNQSSRKRKQ